MPNAFLPLNENAPTAQLVAQINSNFSKIDAEVTTKQFKDNNGNTMIIGNLQNSQFGMSLLDKNGTGLFIGQYAPGRFAKIAYQSGVAVSLDGMSPDDGRIGYWVAKPGQDVIKLLGG